MNTGNTALVRVSDTAEAMRQQAAYEAACGEGLLDKLALGVIAFGVIVDTGQDGEKVKVLEFDNVCMAVSLTTGAIEVTANKEVVIDDSGESKIQAVVFDIGDGMILHRIFAQFAHLEAQVKVQELREQRRASLALKERQERTL